MDDIMNTAFFCMVYYQPGEYQHCEICGEDLSKASFEYLSKKKRKMGTKRQETKQCPKCKVMYTRSSVKDKSGVLQIYVPKHMTKDEASRICHETWEMYNGQLCPNIYRSEIMKLIYTGTNY